MVRLTKKEQPDRSKIKIHEPMEVKYWTKALGVSIEQLHQAVAKVGNSAATVRKELKIMRDVTTYNAATRAYVGGQFA